MGDNIAQFDATLPASGALGGDYVLRRGKVFEIGNYPDKNFSLTLDEAKAAIENFQPCNANLEHKNTILDGRLGSLVEVSMGADGKSIFGTVAEPKWLADLLPEGERKVSLEWDTKKKQMVGIGHVLNPRVPDAVVFNAYAKFSAGEEVIPFAYESDAERDAIPDEDFGDVTNKLFPCRTQQELRQCLDELAYAEDPTAVKTRLVEIAARKGLKIPDNEWRQTGGVSKPRGTDYAYYSKESTRMSTENPAATPTEQPKGIMAQIKALFSGATPEELAQAETELVTAKTGKTPREIELETKLAKFEAEQKNAAFSSIESNATAFADGLVESGQVEAKGNEAYEQAVAAFSAAALADANTEDRAKVACFSADAPTAKFSLTNHLKEVYAKLPKYDGSERAGNLTPEQVAVFEQSKTTLKDEETGEVKTINDAVDRSMKNTFARPDFSSGAANKE
jgi:hypothetical protein